MNYKTKSKQLISLLFLWLLIVPFISRVAERFFRYFFPKTNVCHFSCIVLQNGLSVYYIFVCMIQLKFKWQGLPPVAAADWSSSSYSSSLVAGAAGAWRVFLTTTGASFDSATAFSSRLCNQPYQLIPHSVFCPTPC